LPSSRTCSGPTPPLSTCCDATLTFRHELIRQAVEEGTSSVRKQDLHARVLEALRERDAPAARLAHHAEQAGLADQAGEYAATAAQEAVEVGAHLDAARQYERALAHGESTGKERVQLQIGFGYTAWMAGRSEPAVSVLTEAVAEAERLGDDALLARALDRLSVALWEVDRMAESREAGERAVEVIEHGDDDAALSRALSGLVSMLSVGIDPDAAIAEAPRALAQAEKAGSQEERIQIELSLALAHGIHGDPEAIELFDRLRVEALERGAHQAAMRTYVNECAVAAANRDHATLRIEGSATLTTVMSSSSMKVATDTAMRVHHFRLIATPCHIGGISSVTPLTQHDEGM
jgi:tetratricopeptide (TPR) repeat protein